MDLLQRMWATYHHFFVAWLRRDINHTEGRCILRTQGWRYVESCGGHTNKNLGLVIAYKISSYIVEHHRNTTKCYALHNFCLASPLRGPGRRGPWRAVQAKLWKTRTNHAFRGPSPSTWPGNSLVCKRINSFGQGVLVTFDEMSLRN